MNETINTIFASRVGYLPLPTVRKVCGSQHALPHYGHPPFVEGKRAAHRAAPGHAGLRSCVNRAGPLKSFHRLEAPERRRIFEEVSNDGRIGRIERTAQRGNSLGILHGAQGARYWRTNRAATPATMRPAPKISSPIVCPMAILPNRKSKVANMNLCPRIPSTAPTSRTLPNARRPNPTAIRARSVPNLPRFQCPRSAQLDMVGRQLYRKMTVIGLLKSR